MPRFLRHAKPKDLQIETTPASPTAQADATHPGHTLKDHKPLLAPLPDL